MDPHDRTLSYTSDEPKSQRPPDPEKIQQEERDIITQKRSFTGWFQTVWALALHTALSIGTVTFVLFYIKDRPFNVTDHFATVKTIDGSARLPFAPIQSDVVTILSAMIVAQKWALLAWVAPLCWRIAIFLMERRKRGLSHRDFEVLMKHRVLTPCTYLKSFNTFLIGTLLLASFSASNASPMLTGAISWVPQNHLADGLPTGLAKFWDIKDGFRPSAAEDETSSLQGRESTVTFSVGNVNLGWGRDPNKGVCKRVSDTIGALAVNSTIKNVTLPYFEVHSVEWIEKAEDIPNFPANGQNITQTIAAPLYLSNPTNITWEPVGDILLIPNTLVNWSSDPMDSTIISEKRLLMLSYAYDDETEPSGVHYLTKDLPTNAYRVHEDTDYTAFAWVTFSAGAGRCKGYNCVVSAPFTIQNSTPIELEPHPLTFKALSVATSISLAIVAENSSIPYPWANINDYINGILVRSYSGAWSNLNNDPSTGTAVYSNYVPSLPGLVAAIDIKRVYGWLGVQLLVTLLSLVFLVLQYGRSKYPLISEEALTAFYLDTSGVKEGGHPDPSMNVTLKVQEEENRLTVKVDRMNV